MCWCGKGRLKPFILLEDSAATRKHTMVGQNILGGGGGKNVQNKKKKKKIKKI